MKKRLFIPLICLLAISIVGQAQVKKVYAYKQAIITGNIIGSDDTDIREKDEVKTAPKQNFNYWFYITIPKAEKIVVTGLWIDGLQYKLKSEIVTGLPVKKIIYTGLDKNDTITMAPATSNKVMLIYPREKILADSKIAMNLARSNELVIRYTWKGKTYYTSVKKIKELTPDVRV